VERLHLDRARPDLPGRADGESWQQNYLAMIEAARKHGWIDAQASGHSRSRRTVNLTIRGLRDHGAF